MHNQSDSFGSTFKALTGNDPFPWQTALYQRFADNQNTDALDVPTGLGKTSVMAVWLAAHLLSRDGQGRPPMRLVYVVNRRTIVDQATDVAGSLTLACEGKLHGKWTSRFGGGSLGVSTLRGAKADNGQWLDAPHRPAIVIGTVDMIGSRLLFNGYRTGRWQRSRHAGLLGYDSLLVHDEAHLSKPFQQLVEWILQMQGADDRRRMAVLAMSATAATNSVAEEKLLRITNGDREKAAERLNAVKKVYLNESVGKLEVQLANLAFAHDEARARVLIFVQQPAMAARVFEHVKALYKQKHKVELTNIEMLTGTIRGRERDELLKKPVLQHLLRGWTENEERQTEYLVSTSAGEVGNDFDGDTLVGDTTTIDALIQRIGRSNRRGGAGRESRIDIVLNEPTLKKGSAPSTIEAARLACANFLRKLKEEKGDGFDASPAGVVGDPDKGKVGWRERDGYAAACDPTVPWEPPHDVTLDAWTLTSIQENWALAKDVDPYLHGLDDLTPQTFVAWRAELDEVVFSDEEGKKLPEYSRTTDAAIRDIPRHYALRPGELMHDRPDRVAELLVLIARKFPGRPFLQFRGRIVTVDALGELDKEEKRVANDVRNTTIILPASVGGLSKGMIEPAVIGKASVADVADRLEVGDEASQRARVVLHLSDNGEWTGRAIGETGSFLVASPSDATSPKWGKVRDRWAAHLKMRYFKRIVLRADAAGPSRILLLFRLPPEKLPASYPLLVEKHNQDVLACMNERATGLGLSRVEIEASSFAAKHHDLGKVEECWQGAIIGKKAADEPLAKSLGKGMNVQLLGGYRHEFGSLMRVLADLDKIQPSARDLALHLITTHHGRGRPHFMPNAFALFANKLPPELQPAEIAARFDRLTRRHGHWRLAWLEAVLMSADSQASREHDQPAAEEEDQTTDGDEEAAQ